MNDTERLLELIDGKSTVTVRIGKYAGPANGQGLVDMDENRFPARFLTSFAPQVGEPVHVWSVDGQWFLVGPTRPKPMSGTVVTVSAPNVSLLTSMGSVTAIIGGTAPTSGDQVLIHWTEDGAVSGLKLASTPVAPPTPPDPGGGGGTVKEVIIRAGDAGSTDRGSARWWTGQPRAGNSTYGAWFYGTAVKDTIPAGSVPVSGEIYINRVQDKGDPPRFTLHTSAYKGGVPAMSAYIAVDPSNGWMPLPPTWFEALMGGGAYYGIGLNQGGDNIFASLAQDGLSGALRMKWR